MEAKKEAKKTKTFLVLLMLLLVFADIPISFIDNMTMHAETDSITEQPKDIEIGSVKEQQIQKL